MFVDECVIKAEAGGGGRGCVSFRREKFEPWGGPNGGDGGRGGDIVLLGDDDTNNLVDYRFQPHWKAGRGEHGRGKDQHGADGANRMLKMPLGTVVINEETGQVAAEIVEDGQRIVLCRGGNGGWGNTHFKSSTNRAPRRANPGQPGERGVFRLILKSIADIGLVGFPNAGKSSLIHRLTKARPRVAAYPFTTLHPQIGVAEFADDSRAAHRVQIADIPGLIEGASEDRGLGHRFLRHIERCRLLVLLLDMAGSDGRDPRDDYATLLRELELYGPALLEKPQVIVANKMDLPEAAAHLARYRRRHRGRVFEISCVTGDGLPDLKKELLKRVLDLRAREKKSPSPTA
jgi:GTP-binding protein